LYVICYEISMVIFNLPIMKKIVVILIIFSVQLLNSQDINNRKGQFFVSGGVNRSFYSTSDISFKGNDFNFTLHNVKADDNRYLEPKGLSLDQANFKIGYFFKDNYNIVLGYDNMRYVLRNGEDVKIKGFIDVGSYSYENVKYNFDNKYDFEKVHLSDSFLIYDHSGLKYFFAGINRFDNFNKLLGINTDKFEVNLEEGVDFGVVMPKTNTTILGNEKFENSSNVGFGMSVSAGINLTFFKHFFIKTDIKYGYIDMKDIQVTLKDPTANVKQHFNFIETSYTFGFRFRIFPTKKKYQKQIEEATDLEPEVSEITITNSNTAEIDSLNIDTVVKKEKDTIIENTKNSIATKCPDKKTLEFKEKSDNATDIEAQKGYNWLSLYYSYKCKCDNGSIRPEELRGIINSVVDSYIANTGGIYGEISKVSKCKPLVKDE